MKNDVLDFSGSDVYRSGLGGDSPGPDLRGDQLQGSDQEGGQLGAAGEEEKMNEEEYLLKKCGGPLTIEELFDVFDYIDTNDYPDEKKLYAIYRVMNLPTMYDINKESLRQAIRWLWGKTFERLIKE